MNLAVSLWRLFQNDRLFRWATYASVVVFWFALAWADVRLLVGLVFWGSALVAPPPARAPRLADRARSRRRSALGAFLSLELLAAGRRSSADRSG